MYKEKQHNIYPSSLCVLYINTFIFAKWHLFPEKQDTFFHQKERVPDLFFLKKHAIDFYKDYYALVSLATV